MIEFAERGLHGTSTEEIARRAGISQPYLFRLFGTKKELYMASVRSCMTATLETVPDRRRGATGEAALQAIGKAYMDRLPDPLHLRARCRPTRRATTPRSARSAAGLRRAGRVRRRGISGPSTRRSRASSPPGCCSTSSLRWSCSTRTSLGRVAARRVPQDQRLEPLFFRNEVSDHSIHSRSRRRNEMKNSHDLDVRDHLDRALHGHARQPRRDHRAAGDPARPACLDRAARVDGERLHPDLRRAAADRRRARRPLRAPPPVRARHRDLHGRLRAGRALDDRDECSTSPARCRASAARSSRR